MLEYTLIRGLVVALFILANSFFVAAEFALISVRETRIQQLIELGRPGARTALKLKQAINDFLPAVQFGVTLASLALGSLGEPAIARMLEFAGQSLPAFLLRYLDSYLTAISILVAFAMITFFEVLLGELVPKALALQRAERIALAVAGPMDVFIRMTRPVVRLMNGAAQGVLRLFHAPLSGEVSVHSPEELKLIASESRRMGMLEPSQELIVHRALELNHVVVREVMTPRGKIFSLPVDLPLEQASARIVDEQHSRVPVYDAVRGPEHLIGIVLAKDVARLMHFRNSTLSLGARRTAEVPLRVLLRDVLFVPETKSSAALLAEFQEQRRQIAIVVDEFGTTVGLVTAEDVLEQIVGELEDEFDQGVGVSLNATGDLLLDGSTTLRDLSTQLGWRFPREAGVETLAGFLLSELGHIPLEGEFVEHQGHSFRVEEMSGRRISRVHVGALRVSPPTAQQVG